MENRRQFLKKLSAGALASLLYKWSWASASSDKFGEVLPKRTLTRDGQKVTAFCMGGHHLGRTDTDKEAERLAERSIELGVRFYDNSRVYHRGKSEELMGRFLTPKYREHIFMMTKSPAKTGLGARKHLDESLRALKTDYVDLWQMHHISSPEDVDNRIKGGVVDAFLEAKEKGKARYIGFTGHHNPETHLYFLSFLEKQGIEMDTCQLPLNICDPSFASFQKNVLPVLLDRKYGVIAMKSMAGGSISGRRFDITPKSLDTEDIPDVVEGTGISMAQLHQYVYSLPVSTLCSGCATMEHLEHNVGVLKNLKKLSQSEMEGLVRAAKPFAGNNVENYKHVLE